MINRVEEAVRNMRSKSGKELFILEFFNDEELCRAKNYLDDHKVEFKQFGERLEFSMDRDNEFSGKIMHELRQYVDFSVL